MAIEWSLSLSRLGTDVHDMPRYSGSFSCEIPQWGCHQEHRSNQNPSAGVDMNHIEAIAVLVTVLEHPEDHRPEWPCVRTFELREAWLP